MHSPRSISSVAVVTNDSYPLHLTFTDRGCPVASAPQSQRRPLDLLDEVSPNLVNSNFILLVLPES